MIPLIPEHHFVWACQDADGMHHFAIGPLPRRRRSRPLPQFHFSVGLFFLCPDSPRDVLLISQS